MVPSAPGDSVTSKSELYLAEGRDKASIRLNHFRSLRRSGKVAHLKSLTTPKSDYDSLGQKGCNYHSRKDLNGGNLLNEVQQFVIRKNE